MEGDTRHSVSGGLRPSEGGAVVAWVQGESRYATKVEIDSKGKLRSICTCPYYTTCKHAVALVLAYLDEIKNDRAIPLAPDDDPRIAAIAEIEDRAGRLSDWDNEDDDHYEDDEEDYEAPPPPRSKSSRRREPSWRALLEGMTRELCGPIKISPVALGSDLRTDKALLTSGAASRSR